MGRPRGRLTPNQMVQRWNKRYPHRRKNSYLKGLYGITLRQYNDLVRKQGGVCAICQLPPNGERLGVDHDHATGQIRGLLCRHCNKALGSFQDDPHLVQQAADYLKGI